MHIPPSADIRNTEGTLASIKRKRDFLIQRDFIQW